MRKLKSALVSAGMSIGVLIVGASSPALAKCVQKNPLFGFDVYVDDKYCPPKAKAKPKKVMKSASRKTAKKAPIRMVAKASKPAPVADEGVRHMQTMLSNLGFNPGSIDGVEGPATGAALDKFKGSRGLPSSTSRPNTLVMLERAVGN